MFTISRFILFVITISAITVQAQIRIIDGLSKEPVPFVQIYTSYGEFVGVSNEQGIIAEELLQLMKGYESQGFTLNHMTYDELRISREDVSSKDVLYLIPNVRLLDEIVVKKALKEGFLKISGYYRSYQFREGSLEYFTDGKVEVIYDPNPKKTSVLKRIQERSLASKIDEPSLGFSINMTGPTTPDIQIRYDDLKSIYNLEHEEAVSKVLLKDKQTKTTKGQILGENGIIKLQYQTISEDKPKTYKVVGNESINDYRNEYYIFRGSKFQDINPTDMLYYKWVQNLRFKPKKETKFQKYEAVGEFFIEKIDYISTMPKEGFSKFNGFNYESSYTTEFWKEAEKHPFYQPLPSGVAESLKNNLKLLPNKR